MANGARVFHPLAPKPGYSSGSGTGYARKSGSRAGGNPAPSAAVIDSPSVTAAETVRRPSRGYDGGKKTDGRKRHIATDTQALVLVVLVTAATLQDRAAARTLLPALHAVQRDVT